MLPVILEFSLLTLENLMLLKVMKDELAKHVFRFYQNTASELSDHRLVYKRTKSHTKWRNLLAP